MAGIHPYFVDFLVHGNAMNFKKCLIWSNSNPDYALELRHEAFKRNKFKCFLDFWHSTVMVKSKNTAKHLNLKGLEAVIDFPLHNAGSTYFRLKAKSQDEFLVKPLYLFGNRPTFSFGQRHIIMAYIEKAQARFTFGHIKETTHMFDEAG